MWYNTPQKGGARCVHTGGLPDLIYRFPGSPHRPGGLLVCDHGYARAAGAEKTARPPALPAAGHSALNLTHNYNIYFR